MRTGFSTERFLAAYVAGLGTMLVLDALWLNYAITAFQAALGDMLLDSIRIAPAAVFYLSYIALVLAFAIDWKSQRLPDAALRGAGLGLIGYGTYELTNHATLARWTVELVLTDLAWGAFLTAVVAVVGQYVATRR